MICLFHISSGFPCLGSGKVSQLISAQHYSRKSYFRNATTTIPAKHLESLEAVFMTSSSGKQYVSCESYAVKNVIEDICNKRLCKISFDLNIHAYHVHMYILCKRKFRSTITH